MPELLRKRLSGTAGLATEAVADLASLRPAGKRMAQALAVLSLPVVLTIGGCSWVELKPEAEHIRISSAEAVASCDRVGAITVQSKARLGIYERSAGRVQTELVTLARNEAVKLGADRLVPDSVISRDGEQSFRAFRCKSAKAQS